MKRVLIVLAGTRRNRPERGSERPGLIMAAKPIGESLVDAVLVLGAKPGTSDSSADAGERLAADIRHTRRTGRGWSRGCDLFLVDLPRAPRSVESGTARASLARSV